jgi:FkbH-like protein
MPTPIYFVADFNIDTLARLIEHTAMPGVETRTSPIAPAVATLAAGPPGDGWSALVWTRPEATVPSFARAAAFEAIDADQAIDETRAFAAAVRRFAGGTRATFVATWTLPPWHRGYGPLDYRPGVGIAQLLARMNLALADALAEAPNVFVLDAGRWLAALGGHAWSDKLWHAAKTPFTPAMFEQAALDLAAGMAALEGGTRRIAIVDLDDVLWGGVVGDAGIEGIRLGGHDHVGEAHLAFQHALKGLARRGVQLAIVSRNDEAVALETIDRHPEMQLRRGNFVAWRINWNDKAANVADLLAEIRLGADAAVFIDDSAIERARVRDGVPGILVPEWPADPSKYCEALAGLRCFDAASITAEDRARSALYADESRRRHAPEATDLDTWMRSLDVVVTAAALDLASLERAAQLFNKTNQMNLSTRRLTAQELRAWADEPDHEVVTFRVSDRFGDSGLTGLIGLVYADGIATLQDFLLSCRVMGRNVEEAVLHVAVTRARERSARQLVATLRRTPRNAPCLDFFRRSGMQQNGDDTFVWAAGAPYPKPDWVTVRDASGVEAPGTR